MARTLLAALALVPALAAMTQAPGGESAREAAHRANNVGVALLEQYRYADAAAALRRAIVADPELGLAHYNLGLALLYVPDLEAARVSVERAQALMPGSAHASYVAGLIAKAENRPEDARVAFARVLELDAGDVGANIQLGQILTGLRLYDEAAGYLRRAVEAEPWNATATYALGMALTRSGQRDEGRAMIERFQELRGAPYATLLSETYLEQGRYAAGLTASGAEPGLVDTAVPAVRFVDAGDVGLGPSPAAGPAPLFGARLAAGQLARALPGALALFDADGDGDLDLVDGGGSSTRLLRNDGGRFADAGLGELPPSRAAVAGDVDGDALPDLVLVGDGSVRLLRNAGGLSFADVTRAAGLAVDHAPSAAAALSDVDHDGDLDLVVAGLAAPGGSGAFPADFGPGPNRLWRNDGSGSFEDVTEASGLGAAGHVAAVVPSDFDERRDVDLLLVRFDASPALLQNKRDGSFSPTGPEVGLSATGTALAVAAGDVDKNSYVDFLFATSAGSTLALNQGTRRFSLSAGPAGLAGAGAAQFLDYDNDGLLDIVALGARRPSVHRNLGSRFEDVSATAVAGEAAAPAGAPGRRVVLASGDLDGDGDVDLVTRDAAGQLRVWRNEGGETRASLAVRLAGRVSNRSGVGSKLELRAGSLSQKLETYSASPAPAPADVVFGLGRRERADAVRVLWPAGILQTEIGEDGATLQSPLLVEELDRKPSSCPYLYAWNGERFEFLTDFMGGGEMGYWAAPPGIRNTPDPVEYVRIAGDQLVARDGRWELRVTNELEEALFVDGLRLHVVAHPADVEVHPTEGMTRVAKPFDLIAVRNPRPVLRATDGEGRDLTDAVRARDRRYADGFALLPLRGYAEDHELILDLGEDADQAVLLLNGWTDYAFSSDNVAAAQRGWAMRPPSLEVRDGEGLWQTALPEIGIPVGRPQTVVLELTGLWQGPSREVRLSTNMRIYWDQIRVASRREAVETETRVLEPQRADLRWRGYSAEYSPDGREPRLFEYARVSWDAPWKVFPGRYTREGDVRELLTPGDDVFVFSRPGDEIAVSFDASEAPLPEGWSRTFLLYADGYSKEMDLNSSTPDAMGPLPFHAMSGYPYGDDESYPMTEAKRDLYERYNTRQVEGLLPSIHWSALAARDQAAESEASGARDAPE